MAFGGVGVFVDSYGDQGIAKMVHGRANLLQFANTHSHKQIRRPQTHIQVFHVKYLPRARLLRDPPANPENGPIGAGVADDHHGLVAFQLLEVADFETAPLHERALLTHRPCPPVAQAADEIPAPAHAPEILGQETLSGHFFEHALDVKEIGNGLAVAVFEGLS